jgi:hypothetical protein
MDAVIAVCDLRLSTWFRTCVNKLCVHMQGAAVCRYSTSPNPPHFNHTSYELSTEDKFEIMEICHR